MATRAGCEAWEAKQDACGDRATRLGGRHKRSGTHALQSWKGAALLVAIVPYLGIFLMIAKGDKNV